MIKAYKIYTGAEGDSHVIAGTIEEGILSKATSIRFQESLVHDSLDWHNAPTTQYVITLSGTLQFETHGGETFIIKPGDILIACDTTGTAHKWKLLNDEPWRRAYVAFDADEEINFIPDISL